MSIKIEHSNKMCKHVGMKISQKLMTPILFFSLISISGPSFARTSPIPPSSAVVVAPIEASQQSISSIQTTATPSADNDSASNAAAPVGRSIRYPYRVKNGFKFADDGFPIKDEYFIFTDDELKKIDDVAVVRNALKREQRRLTKMFFEEHSGFRKYDAEKLKEYIEKASMSLDQSLDSAGTMRELAAFTFTKFRDYLLRYSGGLIMGGHSKMLNLTADGSIFVRLVPHAPYDYVALLSLILNLFFGIYFFTR